jgi:hypothetical protein
MLKNITGRMDRNGNKKVFGGYSYSLFIGIMLLSIIFPLPGIDFSSYGGIYRYIDENGDYHFSNCPRDPRYRLYIREKGDSVSPPIDPDRYDHVIEKFSEKYGVDSALVKAIIRAESGFNSNAVSHKGARGLMQLMPQTAEQWSVIDVFDPRENIEGGVRHLKHLLDTFGDNLTLSIAAYNAGKDAVIENHSIPPYNETRNFVREVLRYYESYKH